MKLPPSTCDTVTTPPSPRLTHRRAERLVLFDVARLERDERDVDVGGAPGRIEGVGDDHPGQLHLQTRLRVDSGLRLRCKLLTERLDRRLGTRESRGERVWREGIRRRSTARCGGGRLRERGGRLGCQGRRDRDEEASDTT